MLDMAVAAAEQALAMWGGNRDEITHLYWGTMTGGMHSPTLDIALAKRLGLSMDVERTSIEGMGCLTGFRLLNLGRLASRAEATARVLVVEAELRSAIGNSLPPKAQKGDIVAAALFRDAASAAVVGRALSSLEWPKYELLHGKSRILEETHELVSVQALGGAVA
jgi:predicted naringenin-chalcone synthase